MKLKLLSALSSVLCLALVVAIVLVSGVSSVAAQTSPTVQVGFLLDGSGSIENEKDGGTPGNWNTIRNGIGGALRDPMCIPQDGSVEFTLVVFGNTADETDNPATGVKIPPTIITDEPTADQVGDLVEALQFPSPGVDGMTPDGLRGTETAEALMVLADTMAGSDDFSAARKQAINLVTDGSPIYVDTIPDGCEVDLNLPNDLRSRALTRCARDYLIETLQMTEDQDELDSEFIVPNSGSTDPANWLRDEIVYPQPGSLANFDTDEFNDGWVLVVEDAAEFSDAICRKFQQIINEDVTVSKQVTGNDAPANESFDVTLTCGDTSETFELKDGESGTLQAIAPGTICSATESDPGSDWMVTLPPTLTVTQDASNNLTVTNEYQADGPQVYITESYAVTDLDEDGSPNGRACYWITLDTEPQGPVTVNMTVDSQIRLDKSSMVLDAANWNALDLASSNRVCVLPNHDDTHGATGTYCAGMSDTLFGQASADKQVCGDQLSLIAHSVDENSAPPYDQSDIRFVNVNGPDLDDSQATLDVLLRDQLATATVDVAHYAPFAEDVAGTSVTVRITGDGVDVALENLKYGDVDLGNLLPAGLELTIQVSPTGSATPALEGTYTLQTGVSYTLAAIGGANGWALALLPLVNETTPLADSALLRVGHLAPFADADAPGSTAVDVCTESGEVVVENIEYPQVEDYLALPAGTYDLLLAPAGANCGEEVLDLSPLSLEDGDIVDVFIIGLGPDDPEFSLRPASIESAAGIYLPMINGQ